jgi:formylglycine-generating enzyme required for sulfatase activity
VTNRQYLRFLGSPDYADPELWHSVRGFDVHGQPLKDVGEQAWEWFTRSGGRNRRPDFWDDTYFGASRRLFPVVGLTWFEAAAYCTWLSRHKEELNLLISGNLLFRLPMESEWIDAAGGETDDSYPWQQLHAAVTPETICKYANTYESGLQRTTPVCMYPDGKSFTGIMEMSGNVWEWQANQHSEGKMEFALRGGSWVNSFNAANVRMRICDIPVNFGNSCGFRVLAHVVNQSNFVPEIVN